MAEIFFAPQVALRHFLCHLVETVSREPKHASKQNVNHRKNSWNLSTAESGRRINLNQPVKKALKYVEVMLQVVSSDPLATGHASCWIRCRGRVASDC